MLEQRFAALQTDIREARLILARMEPLLRSIDDRLRKIEGNEAVLKGHVPQLPMTWTLVTSAFGMVLAIYASAFALLRFVLPR